MNLINRIRRMEASPPLFASPLAPLCSVREFWFFFAIIALLLLQARIICWYVNSYDVWIAFLPWLQYISQHGHLHALRGPIGDYLPGYYFLLALSSYLGRWLDPISQVKLLPFIADCFISLLAYRIVALLEASRPISPSNQPAFLKPAVAALIMLALPSLFIDGAVWGQCDSIYISLLLACVYFLLRDGPTRASICFGFALALKLQSVFLLPFLAAALTRKRVRWWHPLVAAAAWFSSFLPSLVEGRSLHSLVHASTGQMGEFWSLYIDIGNLWIAYPYTHLPYKLGLAAGLLLTAVVGAYLARIGHTQPGSSPSWLFFFATLCLLTMPYIMPKMHERYLLPAQVFLVILACHQPRFILPAALLECALLVLFAGYFTLLVNPLTVAYAFTATTPALLLLFRELVRSRDRMSPSTQVTTHPDQMLGHAKL